MFACVHSFTIHLCQHADAIFFAIDHPITIREWLDEAGITQ